MTEPVSSPSWSRDLLLLTLVLGLLFGFRLGSHPLANPDEGRYAEIPREMLAAGEFVTPRLDGVPYFEGCLPVEEMASRGRDTLRYGPMKPVGLVDPVTGEGLYYAIRSADLAVRTLLSEATEPAAKAGQYRQSLRRDFAADLEFGSRLAKRLFLGRFLFGSVPERMVQFTRRSPRFSAIVQDLFAGKQPYLGLKRRLLENLNGSMYDVSMSLGLSRLVLRKAG